MAQLQFPPACFPSPARHVPETGGMAGNSAIAMEKRMNCLCHVGGYAVHRFQFGKGRAAHGLGAAEMFEQPALAGRADAGDLVERRRADRFCALLPMRADGEAVSLVAEALDEIERGRA